MSRGKILGQLNMPTVKIEIERKQFAFVLSFMAVPYSSGGIFVSWP